MRQGPGRGEEKPEGRRLFSHWWKLRLSLWSASLAHYFLSFYPLPFPSVPSLSALNSSTSLFSPFSIYPLLQSLLIHFPPSVPQHPTPLHSNSVAPFVPLLFFNLLSSFPSSIPGRSFPPSLSPLLGLLTHCLYCHTVYLSQTLSRWLSVLGIGTCSAADFHSSCLIGE